MRTRLGRKSMTQPPPLGHQTNAETWKGVRRGASALATGATKAAYPESRLALRGDRFAQTSQVDSWSWLPGASRGLDAPYRAWNLFVDAA
jgi:hypothetical protein